MNDLSVLKVFDCLMLKQVDTITNISGNSGVSIATTYRAIEFLHKNGFVRTLEKVVSENGRRPTNYSIDPDYAYSLCIALDKNCFSFFLVDLLGCIRIKNDILVDTSVTRELLLASIYNTTMSMFSNYGIEDGSFSKVKIIYISAQADVDSKAGRIVRFSGISCLDNFDIADYFREKYGVPVLITKLLHIEAVASCKKCEQYCFSQYVYLHIGVGLGATIIADGKVNAGATGKAGELIQVKNDDGVSWEEAYSIGSLSRTIDAFFTGLINKELYQKYEEEHVKFDRFSINVGHVMQIIEDQLSKGNLDIELQLRKTAIGWAKIINTIYGLLDPEAIIVGGAIGSNTPLTFKFLMEILHDKYDCNYNVLPSDRDVDLHEMIAFFSLEALHSIVKNDVFDKWKYRKVKK